MCPGNALNSRGLRRRQALCEAEGGQYGLACEHEHSCCVLLARTDTFRVGGRWHTWIDYERFQVGGPSRDRPEAHSSPRGMPCLLVCVLVR